MPDKAWKKRERDVANYFNGQRTPLSGGNGKITRADVIHDNLFIEYALISCEADIKYIFQLDKKISRVNDFLFLNCNEIIEIKIKLKIPKMAGKYLPTLIL